MNKIGYIFYFLKIYPILFISTANQYQSYISCSIDHIFIIIYLIKIGSSYYRV